MIERRLYRPCELTAIGMSRESLRLWRNEPDFPRPVRGKFYDIKAIEAFLDKLSGVKPNSIDFDKILEERLLHGKGSREISANP